MLITMTDIRRILTQPGADQTISLYLRVDPAIPENQAPMPAWRIWLKNQLSRLEAESEDKQTAVLLRKQIDLRFEDFLAKSKSIAVFVTPKSQQVIELPVSFTENQIAFGRPAISQLLWLLDEYEQYLIVFVDSEKAKFFSGAMGRAAQEDLKYSDLQEYDFRPKTQMPSGIRPKTSPARGAGTQSYFSPGGQNRDSFEATVDDHVRRFHQEVADHCQTLAKELGVQRIVLGGSQESAHAVKHEMHEQVAKQVIDIVAIPNYLGPQHLLEYVLPKTLEFERAEELRLVEEVINFAKAGGRGALGLESVRENIAAKRVELLLVPWPLTNSSAPLDEELILQTLSNGANIEFVANAAADRLNMEGGIAARLFYAA